MMILKWITNVTPTIWMAMPASERAPGERPFRVSEIGQNDFVGDPRKTEKHSVDELKAMGMVGIYKQVDAEE